MSKRVQIEDPDEWIGRPALVRGANADQFRRLHDDFEREISPKNIFEKLEVRDISYKLAEEQLLKRMQTAVVESARVESLAALLGPTFGDNVQKARKTAQDYFGDGESQSAAKKLVDRVGISTENIEANALHLRMTSIHALDDMIDRREHGRNRIIKKTRQRQEAFGREKLASADNKTNGKTGRGIPRERIRRGTND